MLRRIVPIFVLALLVADGAHAAAGYPQFPVRPIRIVTGEVGGAPDLVVRLMVPNLTEAFGQNVVVESRGGANGTIAAQLVSRASADGHSLLFYAGSLWLSPLIDGTKDEPLKELAPVSLVNSTPNILVVHPTLPVKSVNELIALAKAKPGQLNYGSGGVGSSPYLAGELFKAMAGVDIVRVNYKGGGPAVTDLVGGQLQLMFASATASLPHIASGRLRALAVTSPQPSALAPGLPTISASGLPGFETQGLYAMFAPLGTPAPVVSLVQQRIRQVVNSSVLKERFFTMGVEPVGSTAAELSAVLKAEMVRWGKVFGGKGGRAN
jgi:tripartite-type tricarboxylate transporter receptor subunit TctC